MMAEKKELTKMYHAKLKDIDRKYPLAHISDEAIQEVMDNWPKDESKHEESKNHQS